ncbi:diacylglycerol lipase-alpha-like [Aphidius gifuensis]|uniref:diacylglycerol lipase-alpha-like n=1 Tax=Aphidius gifuensis TaxID=684658 RepID=UPI001CDC5015|nr:diacylglycerol lipase-alpha-like [Aphidius gifuensis]
MRLVTFITLVGQSLDTASILAILLRQDYPNLICYLYAPPGGLLSMPAIYTQKFIISTILGKDFVPLMGLRQMECLRADVINALRQSADLKWKTICSVMCCGRSSKPTAITKLENGGCIVEYHKNKNQARLLVPIDTVIYKTTSFTIIYPPEKTIRS